MKKLIMLCIVPVFLGFRTGQEIDEKRMNRDLEIAKNILATLIKSGSDSFFGGTSIEASYMKDYGVVFTIPEHLVYFHTGANTVIAMPDPPDPVDFDIDVKVDVDSKRLMRDRAKIMEEMEEAQEAMEDAQEEMQEEMEEAQEEMERAQEEMEEAKREVKRIRKKSRIVIPDDGYRVKEFYSGSGKASEIDWEEIMVTFLADYADLIGQLKPDERIIINQKSPFNQFNFAWRGTGTVENDDKTNLSAQVLRKNVTAYKMGKISREEFEDRIEIRKKEPHEKVADLEMFASIFDRFYSHDLSETFYSDGKPWYEVLDGFGAVFHVKASSASGSSGRVHFYSPGNKTWRMESKSNEANEAELYPKFKEDIKAFMLDYGRTIRSLNDNDKVILKIEIHGCGECEIPRTLEVSSGMSLLKQYDQQKISREKAMDEIEIKEKF